MSTADFLKMTEALAARPGAAEPRSTAVKRVTVLGAGPEARALAAHCLSESAEVTLFTAYGAEMEPLRKAGAITIRGEGPVGTYQVSDDAAIAVRPTAELDRAVNGADVIFVTGPILKQRTYAMVLAGHLSDGQTLVLVNSRTMGAIETAWYLRAGGDRAAVTIVELLNAPFWTRAEGAALHVTRPGLVMAGTLPSGRGAALVALERYVPGLVFRQSVVQSSFDDGSGLVEAAALLHGGPALPDGAPPLPAGAMALPARNVFRKLIGAQHVRLIDGLAAERRAVAAKWGARDLPATEDWITIHAGTESGPGARPMPSHEEALALVRCAAIGSLAPLASAARIAGVDVPLTRAMIATAAAILGGDLAHAGRSLEAIGVAGGSLDDSRKMIERIAGGQI